MDIFCITLPLVTITFSAWFCISKFAERKDTRVSRYALFGIA
jgi:hypothetical protein